MVRCFKNSRFSELTSPDTARYYDLRQSWHCDKQRWKILDKVLASLQLGGIDSATYFADMIGNENFIEGVLVVGRH